MDRATEQDFLSGIEPFSNPETSSLHNSKLTDYMADPDSLNSTGDPLRYPLTKPGFSPSPVKPSSSYSSPVVATDSAAFSTAAQEITNRIQQSLASSLKLEKRAEECLSLSPSVQKRNTPVNTRSPSYLRTSSSLSLSKSGSPSKLKVRFEDDEILKTEDLIPTFSDLPHNSYHSPIRTSREDHLFTSPPSNRVSPVEKTLDLNFAEVEVKKPTEVSRNLADSFLLSSLKLPQNDEEREKLFQFMKKMETSAAGDPLSSLFKLENAIGSGVSIMSSASAKTTTSASRPTGISKETTGKNLKYLEKEKNTGFQLRKKRMDHKKTYGSKEVGKKLGPTRTEAKEPLRKNGFGKKNMQKKSLKESKPVNSDMCSAPNSEPPLYTKEGKQTIGGMEMIRNQLQGMIKMDGALGCTPEVAEDYKLCFGSTEMKSGGDAPDSFRSTDTVTLLSAKPSDFVPPSSSPESSVGNVDALINSATSSIFNLLKGNTLHPTTTHTTSVDSSVTVENNILRDTLEKERFRRNHCEKQIQKLQNRILEIQQELAVGQSVARKKDMMIEQLDKTLSKVVDGWKTHEQKLVKTVEELSTEKEKFTKEMRKQNKASGDMHTKLSKLTEELTNTREKLQLKEEEQRLLQQTFQLKTHEIARVIDQKNASLEKLLNDKQAMVEDINKLTRKMEEVQEASEQEKERFAHDLMEHKSKLEDQLELEKTKLEQARSKNLDLQKMLSTTQQEVTRLEDLMGSLRQTIDSLKMQGSLEETKYTAAMRKMEAQHLIELENKVTEKMTKFHEEAEKKEKELRESHHKQMMELASAHQTEHENQCKMYEDRIEQLQIRARIDIEEKERKFQETLREKNEGMRRQMINKMQNLLQAHYNETLEVVGSTTGNTPMRHSQAGTLSNLLQDMRGSTHLAGSRLHDISNLNTSTMTLQDTLRQTDATVHQAVPSSITSRSDRLHPDTSSVTDQPVHPTLAYPSVTSDLTTSTFSVFSAPAIPSNRSFVPSGAIAQIDAPNKYSVNQAGRHDVAIISQANQGVTTSASDNRVTAALPMRTIPDESKAASVRSNAFEAEINLPMSMSLTPAQVMTSDNQDVLSPVSTQDGDRRHYLQHYIKMLLDKSPGEPLNAPSPTTAPGYPTGPSSISHLSPILEPSKVTADENKENAIDQIQPNHVTSEIALGVINFLNQQLKVQPSPDLIPKSKTGGSPQKQKHLKAQNQRLPQSAFHRISMTASTKPQQHLNKSASKRTPKKQEAPQLSLKDLEANHSTVVSDKQVGDISRMLGAYMSGDTQIAAEKLLSYLAESQSKGNHEASLNMSQMSKSKNNPKTPSKGGPPAWR